MLHSAVVERCDETCSVLIIFSTNSGWSIFLVKTKAKTGFPFSNPFDISRSHIVLALSNIMMKFFRLGVNGYDLKQRANNWISLQQSFWYQWWCFTRSINRNPLYVFHWYWNVSYWSECKFSHDLILNTVNTVIIFSL